MMLKNRNHDKGRVQKHIGISHQIPLISQPTSSFKQPNPSRLLRSDPISPWNFQIGNSSTTDAEALSPRSAPRL